MREENSQAEVWSDAAHAEGFLSSGVRKASQSRNSMQGSSSRGRSTAQSRWIDFAHINRAALSHLAQLLACWIPGGRIEGAEYVARNPKRNDRRPGSFKVNLVTGRWADFAIGDKGGDPISLAAYLASCSRIEAAHLISTLLGIEADG